MSTEGQVKLDFLTLRFQMLGVPLGSDPAFVGDFVGKKLLGRLQSTISKLVEFKDFPVRLLPFAGLLLHRAGGSLYEDDPSLSVERQGRRVR